MGMFLNSSAPFQNYKSTAGSAFFVDKSPMIGELIPFLGTEQRYFCITRPRRFGKSVMANMLAAFFQKTPDGAALFGRLAIAKNRHYREL